MQANNTASNILGKPKISVVGAGLAGSECALQLAARGYPVDLYEMRPATMTEAHKTEKFAELVCSNSFGSLNPVSAPGQLKWEARQLGSFILAAAEQADVPAGQALAIDREKFSEIVTSLVRNNPLITIKTETVESIYQIPRPTVLATGPLTHPELAKSLQEHFGDENLFFFDAIAPIIDADSIDMEIAWRADRYDKGTPDYINCPLNKEQYDRLVHEIQNARKIEPKDFEKTSFFEGCMPVEVMVDRGPQTLRFGPMKPVGLTDPRTGRRPWAVVQLRPETRDHRSYNIVGFQTRMAYGEQTRVFRLIPGLEHAEFLKLGSIHRNLFVNSPKRLSNHLSSQNDPHLFLAGQITGVEGYFESTCIGLLVARFLDSKLSGQPIRVPPRDTAMGALLNAITDPDRAENFQPTNINFGLMPAPVETIRDKSIRKQMQVEQAQKSFAAWAGNVTIHPSQFHLNLPL